MSSLLLARGEVARRTAVFLSALQMGNQVDENVEERKYPEEYVGFGETAITLPA
jgi:hypothetical protein